MLAFENPAIAILRLAAVVLILTVHEYFHAWSALRLGDDTALREGRVTLNPLAHLELLGTLMILFAPIGWAKPVPVNPGRLRQPVRDNVLVSFAGPASSLALGALFGLAARLAASSLPGVAARFGETGGNLAAMVYSFLLLGSLIGFGVGLFNLLPIRPLDGSHILEAFIPQRWRQDYENIAQYGWMMILALVLVPTFTGKPFILDYTLIPALYFLVNVFAGVSLFAA